MRSRPSVGLAAAFCVAALACAEAGPSAPEVAVSPKLAAALNHTSPAPVVEELTVCKHGSAATFEVVQPSGTTMHNLADGDCELVATGIRIDITVTEVAAEPGFMFDHGEQRSQIGLSFPPATTFPDPSITVRIGNDQGHVLTFFNVPVPPPVGGEGCTPGYWKQPHHWDSWVGYNPDDLFVDVFGVDAFPGMTLVEVAGQGGGKLNALGRHTVAALLNATSSVNYDLTEQEVIDAFVAAYNSGNYNAQKNIFEGYNEQGCPLN